MKRRKNKNVSGKSNTDNTVPISSTYYDGFNEVKRIIDNFGEEYLIKKWKLDTEDVSYSKKPILAYVKGKATPENITEAVKKRNQNLGSEHSKLHIVPNLYLKGPGSLKFPVITVYDIKENTMIFRPLIHRQWSDLDEDYDEKLYLLDVISEDNDYEEWVLDEKQDLREDEYENWDLIDDETYEKEWDLTEDEYEEWDLDEEKDFTEGETYEEEWDLTEDEMKTLDKKSSFKDKVVTMGRKLKDYFIK